MSFRGFAALKPRKLTHGCCARGGKGPEPGAGARRGGARAEPRVERVLAREEIASALQAMRALFAGIAEL
ncbi:hypothetical protein [Leucobacter chromiireducens]|uniref:MarR family transcriptional regulator n=1 Tax=Leucobacter chromiireducens subsp. solipictus TaxID=398235 RepID=A0ABS1SH97_9MICO|nr:hypothetical protein [Leucobacter chromiireducens]MBL3679944.1 hypothetical protein [Leucobacter chromiireducens subsp. solipictus]